MSRDAALLASAIVLAVAALADAAETAPQSLTLRSDWRFVKDDPAGAESRDFDDSSWESIRLPHDWAIKGPFDPTENGYAAKLPWRGVGWYRKSLALDCEPGDRVYLDFDGVMAFPKVFVNGRLAGEWDYGYTSFRVDATPYLNLKGDNVFAVRVDTTRHGTRWYPGAGIYRKVTLQVRKPIHFAHWGAYVTTPEVTNDSATVNVQSTVENHSDTAAEVQIDVQIRHPDPTRSSLAAAGEARATIPAGEASAVSVRLAVHNPERWDIRNPKLYEAHLAIRPTQSAHNRIYRSLDNERVPFGIRTFQFTADDGFHLNGRRVQLNGVNLHHDHGPLGAAFYPRAMQRQLEIMREMGVNAIRTSHNPPAPEVLDLCDQMGLLVWDEAFDKWNETAARVGGEPSHEKLAQRHLRSLVTRDRNHPSVVVWSIGNEIPGDKEGVTPQRVRMMCDIVRKYDATRPVGLGCHIPEQARTQILDALDLTGWNYGRRYEQYRRRHPDKPIIYSESASALSTRGFYELPLPTSKTDYSKQLQVDSYDFNAAPWSDIADAEFALMETDRFVAGEFVWTGFDYLGEPTPFERQAKSSYFGVVDLCGIPKDRFYLYRSHWRPNTPTVHIVPHWNWPEQTGLPVPVFVYTNGDEAELFLNGKSLGRQKKGVAPTPPQNFARGAAVTASSHQPDNQPSHASDGQALSRWCAANPNEDQWWQVDLGAMRPLKCILLEFEREAKNYGYQIAMSDDAEQWQTIVTQPASDEPRWGGDRTATHEVDARARHVRIQFTELRQRAWASIREFQACPQRAETTYYAPTYDYRLRWNDVVYKPGELRAVAYRDGAEIGTAVVRTAGEPAAIRLTPDRSSLVASGDDLCYVLVEALDKDGVVCPLADDLVRFRVAGAGEIAAVGNGNPLSLEPFQASQCRLFFGKAMLIVRTIEGQSGETRIAAESDRLADAEVTCVSAAP